MSEETQIVNASQKPHGDAIKHVDVPKGPHVDVIYAHGTDMLLSYVKAKKIEPPFQAGDEK